jgi:hypothetical protein
MRAQPRRSWRQSCAWGSLGIFQYRLGNGERGGGSLPAEHLLHSAEPWFEIVASSTSNSVGRNIWLAATAAELTKDRIEQ